MVSEVDMHPHRQHRHRTAIAVVPRIRDVLKTARKPKASPQMRRIVALEDSFGAVVELPVPQQEPEASQSNVLAVIA
jgi:hypothetical protein